MATWTLSGLVPVNIPLALDAGVGSFSVQENWTLDDEPFASQINVGETIVSFSGSVTVTADASNPYSMLVRIYKSFDATETPYYLDLGYLSPGQTDTFPFNSLVDQAVVGSALLFSFYFNQSPDYRTKLTIDDAEINFVMSDGSGPEPEPGGSSQVFVHTLNGGKGKWSRYLFADKIDAFSQLSGELFIRMGDMVVKVTEGLLTDYTSSGVVGITGLIQWPWIDVGAPGQTKQMVGFDMVGSGVPSVSFGYSQSSPSAFTTPYTINPDTMTGMMIPMPLMAPSFSPKITFASWTAWNLRSLTLYLNDTRGQP